MSGEAEAIEVTVGALTHSTSRVLAAVGGGPARVVTRHGEPVAMLTSIDHALMGLLASADEFVALRDEAEREVRAGVAEALAQLRGLPPAHVGRRAVEELRMMSALHRAGLQRALAEQAAARAAPAVVQVPVGRRIAGCVLMAEPAVGLVYALRSRSKLLERLVGPEIVERQRGRRWERILHGRDPRFRLSSPR